MGNAAPYPKSEEQTIPQELVKEEIRGVKYYYPGFRDVLENKTTLEAIMGCSSLQSIIIDYLFRVIYKSDAILDKYHVFSNEIGYHAGHKDNLSFDIGLFDQSKLTGKDISVKYVQKIAPKIVFEVDTQVELAEIPKDLAATKYEFFKTERLLELGVETVVWIFSKPQKVMIAHKDEDWRVQSWDKPFNILDLTFEVGAYLIEKGVNLRLDS